MVPALGSSPHSATARETIKNPFCSSDTHCVSDDHLKQSKKRESLESQCQSKAFNHLHTNGTVNENGAQRVHRQNVERSQQLHRTESIELNPSNWTQSSLEWNSIAQRSQRFRCQPDTIGPILYPTTTSVGKANGIRWQHRSGHTVGKHSAASIQRII